MEKHYIVSDGTLVLFLWPAEEGGYAVTSPLDPALNTQGDSIEEAFEMAYDALETLRECRADRETGSKGNASIASRKSNRKPARSR
jgi:predicted RNase H-like HicB family nuclease